MRKTFMIAFTITTLLALAIGGAYTWHSSATKVGGAPFSSGKISAAITDVEPTGDVLYPLGYEPTDYVEVLTGLVQNTTPSNPGIAIHATEGIGAPLMGGYGCGITGTSLRFDDLNAIAPNAKGDRWYASFAMAEDAADSCQNQTFDAIITVNVAT
jgi:hypothetical protein